MAEKNREYKENLQKLKEKQDADEKQRRQNKEQLKKLLKERHDKKNQYNRNLMIGKGLLIFGAGAIAYYALIKPKEESPQTIQPQKPGDFLKKEHPKLPLKDSTQTGKNAGHPINGNEDIK